MSFARTIRQRENSMALRTKASSPRTNGMKSFGRFGSIVGVVIVDGDLKFEAMGDYSGIESTPSVGPCFGSAICIREFNITPIR